MSDVIIIKARGLNKYQQFIPNIKIGDVVRLFDIWNGCGKMPKNACRWKLSGNEWLICEFKILCQYPHDSLENIIQVTRLFLKGGHSNEK